MPKSCLLMLVRCIQRDLLLETVPLVHSFSPLFGLGLAEGWFKGHPYEVVEGGLDGLQKALQILEEGKISAKKLVLRIADN